MDKHEPLLTRGDVEKVPEWKWLIFHPCNTVLVHHKCHMSIIGHGGKDVFEKCARQLVEYEGYENVRAFLVAMLDYYPTNAKDALKKFDLIDFKRSKV
jgi:hypothetical protein